MSGGASTRRLHADWLHEGPLARLFAVLNHDGEEARVVGGAVRNTLLGLPAPTYHHHRLILDAEGRKLSKSTHATALRELRQSGATPADIRRIVGLA